MTHVPAATTEEAMLERLTPIGTDSAYRSAVAETHSGLVFFAGHRAFELEKAFDLGFAR